jgi:hypothetical protein
MYSSTPCHAKQCLIGIGQEEGVQTRPTSRAQFDKAEHVIREGNINLWLPYGRQIRNKTNNFIDLQGGV